MISNTHLLNALVFRKLPRGAKYFKALTFAPIQYPFLNLPTVIEKGILFYYINAN